MSVSTSDCFTSSRPRDPSFSRLIELLETQDPRLVRTISVVRLFESQQERIPPALLADSGVSFDELPWGAPFSVQAQLKRLADVTGLRTSIDNCAICWYRIPPDLA